MSKEDWNNPFEDFDAPKSAVEPAAESQAALTQEHMAFIDANWDKMDLMDITRKIFKNEKLDGRSGEGKVVRTYMTAKGYKYKTTKKETKEEVILQDDQKEFCLRHATSMRPYEIARILFKDETLIQFSKESLAVQNLIKSVNPMLLNKNEEYTDVEYVPPTSFAKVLKRINEATMQNLEEEKLNVKARKCVEKAGDFMKAPRFVQTVSILRNVSERTIFESEYVRSVWDKPDLTTDEINLYINLINEYVIQARLHSIMSKLNNLLENVTNDPDGKISISLSDAIKTKSDELNQSANRQQKLVGDLTGRRSDRQKAHIAKAKSLVSLVEAFREETERKNIVRLAELRKKSIKDEMERLENLDEWEARVFGISKDEILE